MLCSLTVTTYLGMANGSEIRLPHWACSQKLPLSKILLGICTVILLRCVAAMVSSGLCLAESKRCSTSCKVGICCNTRRRPCALNTHLLCTASMTLLLLVARGSCGATSVAIAAAVEAVGTPVPVAYGAPDTLTVDCIAMSPSTVCPVFALFLCKGPLGVCPASALFLCKGPQGTFKAKPD